MRLGAHNSKLKSARWLRALETFKFKPRLFNPHLSLKGSCGTTALATLTGISPRKIEKQLPKNKDWWTDRAVKKFLRKNGYEVTEITVSRVTQSPDWEEAPITGKHVLLVSQEVLMGEGTWAVIYDYQRYHNFEQEQLHLFEFINNPLWTVYAISHPKWQNMPPKNYQVKYDPALQRVVPK